MSAETLRLAAALIRERAGAATPGPWDSQWPTTGESWVFSEDSTGVCQTHRPDDPDTLHIASWHPNVALAVARWLEAESWVPETDIGDGVTTGGPSLEALAVAHAYLGESE